MTTTFPSPIDDYLFWATVSLMIIALALPILFLMYTTKRLGIHLSSEEYLKYVRDYPERFDS